MLKLFPAYVPLNQNVHLHLPGRYIASYLKDWRQSPQSSMGLIELHHRSVENIIFQTDMINSVVQFQLKNFNQDMIDVILELGVHPDTRFLLVGNTFKEWAHPHALTLDQILLTLQSI